MQNRDTKWLHSLIVASATLQCGWQVITPGKNSEDIERYVVNLLHETHRLSLLSKGV